MSLGALILCGGASRRMGRPKATLPFLDEALLQRVVRLVGEAAQTIAVVAAPDQELPSLPPDVIRASDPVAHRGPLQGIAVGLGVLPDSVDLAYVTATDAPFLVPAWIDRLATLIGEADLALPEAGGFQQPLAALYRRGPALREATRLLASDRLRPVFLAERLPTRIVTEDELRVVDPRLATLRNLNTTEDYADALLQERYARANGGALPTATVEFYGVPRLRAGRGRVVVNAATVAGVIAGLGRECPGLAGEVIRDGRLHPAYRLCLDGRVFVGDAGDPIPAGSAVLLLAADAGG